MLSLETVAALAVVPLDGQRVERLLGLPPALGDHRDRILEPDDLVHALHAGDLGLVDRLQRALEHRALRDRGVEHAGHAHVDAVDRLALDLVGDVEPLGRLADQAPVPGVLERHVLRRRDLRRRFGHLAERDGAAARQVGDDAVRGAALAMPRRSTAPRRRRSASRARSRRPCATAPANCGCCGCRRSRSRPRRGCAGDSRPGAGTPCVTLLQSHSSSSATSIGSAVSAPWPISERATRMVTVSSGAITIQAVISGAPPAACAAEWDVEAERQRAAGRGDADQEAAAIDPPRVRHRSPIKRSPPNEWPRAPADRCRNGKYW